MKSMRTPLLSVLLILMTSVISLAQKTPRERVAKAQEPREYPHYQETWYKDLKSNLKESVKDTKKSNKTPKVRKKKRKKIIGLKSRISKLNKKKKH